jgi:low temperature requirement protein LtrA
MHYLVRVISASYVVAGMRRRDPDEQHRASTPLELLFDLTFVVAVAHVAAELAHAVVADDLGHGVTAYLMVFFAIWWAWMNFTWFASAYDCDDALYRVMTALQMAGVLVLAAGVDSAFEDKDFGTVVVGYVIMRVAMVGQWLRASLGDPDGRKTAQRYAVGTLIVQVAWTLRLLLPESLGMASFLVLVAAELVVPPWAERPRRTTWHPEHIAERYGLFTIIVLGESVLASSNAISTDFADGGLTLDLALLGVGGLVLLFGMWWVYFLHETGEALRTRRHLDFLWGYSHYAIFASVAAVGAGLEAAIERGLHDVEASARTVGLVLAVAVSVYLVLVALVHGRLSPSHRPSLLHAVVGAVLLVVIALTVASASLPSGVLLFGVVVVGLVVLGSRAGYAGS